MRCIHVYLECFALLLIFHVGICLPCLETRTSALCFAKEHTNDRKYNLIHSIFQSTHFDGFIYRRGRG
jgi:hypothetical protein